MCSKGGNISKQAGRALEMSPTLWQRYSATRVSESSFNFSYRSSSQFQARQIAPGNIHSRIMGGSVPPILLPVFRCEYTLPDVPSFPIPQNKKKTQTKCNSRKSIPGRIYLLEETRRIDILAPDPHHTWGTDIP